MKKVDIVEVFAYSLDTLIDKINNSIEDGYSLHGGITKEPKPSNVYSIGGDYCYTQFMIKEFVNY